MQVSSIHKAKTHLSELIKKAEAGEDVIICRAGRPSVRLVKFESMISHRKAGIWKNRVKIAEDFDTLPERFLSAFRGE